MHAQDFRPVTVVVPVYGHLPSLLECVRSIKKYVDLSVHKAILVNDVGPEADRIEAALLAEINGIEGITYYRNPRNLGFVGTCNRAVYELDDSSNDILLLNSDAELTDGALDEMIAVLNTSEKHAVVCPRSNNATIATIPFRNRSGKQTGDVERTKEVFTALKDSLPRYTIAPVSVGFCFLARRSVIDNYGLFDEAFAPGYSEENDFCLRVSELGFSALIANRALVLHESGMSFDAVGGSEIQLKHEAKLIKRYPYYPLSVADFLTHGYSAVDHFADLIVPDSRAPKRVLIDLHHLSHTFDGTSRNALSFIEVLSRRPVEPGIQFVVSAPKETIKFFKLERFAGLVVAAETLADEIFDLGFSLTPLTTTQQLLRFNRLCAVWVVSHLDVIALRSWFLRSVDWPRKVAVQDSLTYSDLILTISDFSARDAAVYFEEVVPGVAERIRVLPQGRPSHALSMAVEGIDISDLPRETSQTIKSGKFALVMGNGFAHKQVKRTLAALVDADVPVVALTDFNTIANVDANGHHLLPSGRLNEELMEALITGCALMIFPSNYEGFGLPIAEAAFHGKPVIAFDTEVAREVVATMNLESYVQFFSSFTELAALADAIAIGGQHSTPGPKSDVRTLDVYNAALLDEILAQAQKPLDVDRLSARWSHFMGLSQHLAAHRGGHIDAHINVFGIPTATRLGSRKTVLISIEGLKKTNSDGEIVISDGETIVARAQVEGGQSRFPMTFEHQGKRGLRLEYFAGSKKVVTSRVMQVVVAKPKDLEVAGMPARSKVGSKVSARISVPGAVKADRGVLSVRDGATILATAEVVGASVKVQFQLDHPGQRYLLVEYDSVPRKTATWGRSVIAVEVSPR